MNNDDKSKRILQAGVKGCDYLACGLFGAIITVTIIGDFVSALVLSTFCIMTGAIRFMFQDAIDLSFSSKPVATSNVFRVGDVVEVLSLSKKQMYDIHSQTCDFNSDLKNIIGMRYKVADYCEELGYELDGWNHGGHTAAWFQPEQLLKLKSTYL